MDDAAPQVERARRLAGEMLDGSSPRWRHVRAVADEAHALSAGLTEHETDSVIAAAWVHDIGYAPELAITGLHALDGARHLQRLGFPADVVALVAFHTGAMWEADERGLLDALSAIDPPPEHLLDTLTTADLSIGPAGHPVPAEDRLVEILARYEPQHPVHRAVRRSEQDLIAAVERTHARLRELRVHSGRQPT